MRTSWHTFEEDSPSEIRQAALFWLTPPRVSAHRCKCATLPDGKILIVAYNNDSKPVRWITVPPIPL